MNRSLASRRRPLLGRVTALLWAIAFLLGTAGEGYGLHPCPHHGNGGAHGEQPAQPQAAAHGEHPGHGAAAPLPAGHAENGPHAPHDGPCTCGSACQASAGAAMPAGTQEPIVPAAIDVPVTGVVAEGLTAPNRPPHFLPFAQAPPRAR